MKESVSRGEGRKRVIAEVALELYLERGFGVSIDDVAEAASASKQTLYRFFGGREGLVRAAMEIELERVIGPMRDAASHDGSSSARLELFATAYQQTLFSNDCLVLYRFVIGTATESPDIAAIFNEAVVDYVLGLVTPLVASALQVNDERARIAADVFIGTLQGSELNRSLAGSRPNLGRLEALRLAALEPLSSAPR